MAVVQISKIQVRRGQKNSNSGIPQLSSAEFAWAIDTQELFIGNGSVSEGAPYVGNTKILTEHDNILDLAGTYQFASTDTSITQSIPRGFQSKLDEYVSVVDFGAVGDGSTDCTTAFETAFSQLFRNANPKYKKVLMIPNGTYLISNALAIPSGTIIRGETPMGAKINIGSNNIRFVTSAGQEAIFFDSSNRPSNIDISNLTILRTTGQVVLTGVANSSFTDITFKGNYTLGTTVSNIDSEKSVVAWSNNIIGTAVTDVNFKRCTFDSVSIAMAAIQSNAFETRLQIQECKFFINYTAIYINGVTLQSNKWTISDTVFEQMHHQAFRSTYGTDTLIRDTRFINCGNGNGTAASPTTQIVYFGESSNNIVLNCTSDRQQAAGIVSSDTVASVTEVYNGSKVNFTDRIKANIYLSDSYRPLTVLSAFNKYLVVNYFLELGPHSRLGQLILTIGDYKGEVSVSDNYHYSVIDATSPEGIRMTNFQFTATLTDNDADSGIDTIVLSYQNPLSSGATGTITFDVTYGV